MRPTLFFAVTASVSEAIRNGSMIPDCFIARACLRKLLAFVAGNDGSVVS